MFFSDAHERMQRNPLLAVVESSMRGGDTGLSWNVTAPCRLEAEMWLCKKDVAEGRCEEITGSRRTLDWHKWTVLNRHWVKASGNIIFI